MDHIFSGLITSKMRVKILMRLFINPSRKAYLRELAEEFGAAPSHIKDELDQLTEANLLVKKKSGHRVLFSANNKHPVFKELHSMVSKALGMDKILESVIKRLGNLEGAYLVGDYAEGKDTGIIDLVLIGNIDYINLNELVQKTEHYIDRKIRTIILNNDEWCKLLNDIQDKPLLLLWKNNQTELF